MVQVRWAVVNWSVVCVPSYVTPCGIYRTTVSATV